MASGVSLDVYCGLSINTALRWGLVETTLFPIRTEPPPPPEPAQPFIHLVKETPQEKKARLHQQTRQDSQKRQDKQDDQKLHMLPNTDLWALNYPGKSYIEVVYKALHDIPTQVPAVREIFAQQVTEGVLIIIM